MINLLTNVEVNYVGQDLICWLSLNYIGQDLKRFLIKMYMILKCLFSMFENTLEVIKRLLTFLMCTYSHWLQWYFFIISL